MHVRIPAFPYQNIIKANGHDSASGRLPETHLQLYGLQKADDYNNFICPQRDAPNKRTT